MNVTPAEKGLGLGLGVLLMVFVVAPVVESFAPPGRFDAYGRLIKQDEKPKPRKRT